VEIKHQADQTFDTMNPKSLESFPIPHYTKKIGAISHCWFHCCKL
jgi:hypothetical protein